MHKLISFVISESPKAKKGALLEQKPVQSAPQYYEISIPQQFALGQEKVKINNKEITFFVRSYPPENILVEASVEVDDIFSLQTFDLREKLVDSCQKISQKYGGSLELSEEYSVALVSGYEGDPEQFLSKKQAISAFLKSEKELLDENEIDYTLSKQIKYAKDDLVIVDWDGAFVFDTSGQIDDIIDLFQVANLQLLRYRVLDRELDERLAKTAKFTKVETKILIRKELGRAFKEMIGARSKSISDFEALERDIKLIGDWYSARLHDLVSKKFKLDEWRKRVQEKMDSIEDIYNIVSENFSVSRHQLLELVQIILFFVLQAGWFVLLILEFIYFTR
ncbi:MAG: hypothetical protein AAB646_02185 [Patescibacteria group bacterium]